MDIVADWIPIASTFSVLVPLFLLLRNFKSHDIEIKALALYLAIGFIIDVGTWYFYSSKNSAARHSLHHAFDLYEEIFLYWFLGKVSPYVRVKPYFTHAWIMLVPFWLMRFYYPEWAAWFKTSTEVFIAFASCFFILRMVEKTDEDISRNLTVWILLGIFFYSFSTYFIMGIIRPLFSKAWYSHNLMNITTNLIYCFGFIRAKKEFPLNM